MQVKAVVRLDGGLNDADTVGVIAWARHPDNNALWWPVEILDPFHMPVSRILPPACTLGENARNLADSYRSRLEDSEQNNKDFRGQFPGVQSCMDQPEFKGPGQASQHLNKHSKR